MSAKPAPDPAAPVRRWLVVRLVRFAARGWDKSYATFCWREWYGFPQYRVDFWTWVACRREHVALSLARNLDRDNLWMGQEMAEHAWWG